jgi:hypothetical protein
MKKLYDEPIIVYATSDKYEPSHDSSNEGLFFNCLFGLNSEVTKYQTPIMIGADLIVQKCSLKTAYKLENFWQKNDNRLWD